MKSNEKGKKRKEKEPLVNIKVCLLEHQISLKQQTSGSIDPTSANVMDHDYAAYQTCAAGSQDDVLTPLPLSTPDTPVKPKGKKKKPEMSLVGLQENIIQHQRPEKVH